MKNIIVLILPLFFLSCATRSNSNLSHLTKSHIGTYEGLLDNRKFNIEIFENYKDRGNFITLFYWVDAIELIQAHIQKYISQPQSFDKHFCKKINEFKGKYKDLPGKDLEVNLAFSSIWVEFFSNSLASFMFIREAGSSYKADASHSFFNSKTYGEMTIIEIDLEKNLQVQFLETGYFKYSWARHLDHGPKVSISKVKNSPHSLKDKYIKYHKEYESNKKRFLDQTDKICN